MRTELGEGLTPFCQTTLSWDKDTIEGESCRRKNRMMGLELWGEIIYNEE